MSRPVEGKTPEVPTEEGPKAPPNNVNQNNATNAKKGYGSLTTKSGHKKPGYGSLTTKSGNKTGSTISPVVPSQRDTSKSKDNNPEVQSSVNERAQEKKIASIVMRRFLVRYATFLVVFGCIICSCLILMRAVQHSLYTKNVWKMMQPPERVEFGNFAVTSSSETCNELMRPYLYGDKRVVEIATAMALCLLIAEPHNSGLGGQSIALYANPTNQLVREESVRFWLGRVGSGRTLSENHQFTINHQSIKHQLSGNHQLGYLVDPSGNH